MVVVIAIRGASAGGESSPVCALGVQEGHAAVDALHHLQHVQRVHGCGAVSVIPEVERQDRRRVVR